MEEGCGRDGESVVETDSEAMSFYALPERRAHPPLHCFSGLLLLHTALSSSWCQFPKFSAGLFMSMKYLDSLRGLGERDSSLSIRTFGPSAFVRAPRFIARICLHRGEVEWLIDRPTAKLTASTCYLPRHIREWG